MMKEMKTAQDLFENEELMNALQDVQSAEDLAKVLEQFNIQLEDGLTIEDAYNCFVKGKDQDEIGEEALENIAGGFASKTFAVRRFGANALVYLSYHLTTRILGKTIRKMSKK